MRRERYEFTISKPQVIIKQIDGILKEPFEITHIEVPQEYSGTVIEELSRRKGEMRSLNTNEHDITTIEFYIPTRGLMGYRNNFLTVTRGLGILTSVFDSYAPHQRRNPWTSERRSRSPMTRKSHRLLMFQHSRPRLALFVGPGEEVYEGMVVGENYATAISSSTS